MMHTTNVLLLCYNFLFPFPLFDATSLLTFRCHMQRLLNMSHLYLRNLCFALEETVLTLETCTALFALLKYRVLYANLHTHGYFADHLIISSMCS